MIRPPVNHEEVVKLYGEPKLMMRDDGTPSPLWELRMSIVEFPQPLPLGWRLDLTCRGARVNQAIAAETERVFRGLQKAGVWDHIKTFDGGYTWRAMRGATSKLSMHALGGAIDFNAATNQLGSEGDIHPGIVEVFEAHGWTWGGRWWHRPDPMHFQFGKGY